ncbi:hypothetical protein, partial [Parasutterella sp.]|uniref:hypothetical protein n=1 Tax=Parasutterella sp. TaxID=2049037 RepID=UPI003AB34A25
NHWLNEMDAENGQAIIYAKESDEIVRKLSLKSSEGGYKVTIVSAPIGFIMNYISIIGECQVLFLFYPLIYISYIL